jgi:putative nucleotidyltransferase with HDIG domain
MTPPKEAPILDLPSRSECLRLMRERRMLAHIIDHSLRVAEVSMLVARRLTQAGADIDLSLIEAAALLHDIAKIESLTTRTDHALAGQELIRSMGYPEVLGLVIRHHVRLPEDDMPCPVECEIVNYSDKRVNGDVIVSLTERFDYIRGRYGRTEDIVRRITELEGRTRELERRLFARLPFRPEELVRHLEVFLLEEA